MTQGVIYYNTGRKCLARLVTTIYSLRKHYSGPVAILSEGDESHEICMPIAEQLDVQFVPVEFQIPEGAQSTFLKKTLLHKPSPYDISAFIDSDSLITGDITPLFRWAEQHEFVGTAFSNWRADGRIMVKRIEAWRPHHPDLISEALKFGPALNAGCYAFRRDSKFMNEWYKITLPGRHIHLPEETSMQVALFKYPHYVAPQIYNCSCKHSDPFDPDVRIIHYHRNKHCRIDLPFGAELWMRYFLRVLDKNIANIKAWHLDWDSTLRKYIEHRNKHHNGQMLPTKTTVEVSAKVDKKVDKKVEKVERQEPSGIAAPRKLPPPYLRDDLTIVTAVSDNMLDTFKRTVPTWIGKPQFANLPVIIFTNGFGDPEKELKPYVNHKNVRYLRWNMPEYEDMRELMLSSFVLGAAQHVTTKHWVKIDIDAYFSTPEDIFTEHDFEYDIIGHRWGQSLVANLSLLDEWARKKGLAGDDILPAGMVATHPREKFGHKRFISWICLHKSEFVREAAVLAGGRLPAPSHDTYLWYVAQRLGRKWDGKKFNTGAGHSKRWKKVKAAVDSLQAWGVQLGKPS